MIVDKDIEPRNDKGQRHGLFIIYDWYGVISRRYFYQNDIQVGYSDDFFIYQSHRKKFSI